MNRNIATHRFFTQETQRAFYERVNGYITQEELFINRYERLRQESGFQNLVRLDLGQNRMGCAPEVRERWRHLANADSVWDQLSAYPEVQGGELQAEIARLHGIRPEWILMTAGLEQAIAMVAASFLENRDRFLVTDPGFFLFDEDSRRHGGIPLVLPLDEDNDFAWTSKTQEEYEQVLGRLQPKLIWLANPNNPTGRLMDQAQVERIVAVAETHLAMVVIDEAYGEYTDPNHGVRSASALLGKYRNLIVLRGFSKAHGLAGIRLGYAMVNNREVGIALRMHRPNYPFTRTSFELAQVAIRHLEHLVEVRRVVEEQRHYLRRELSENRRIHWTASEASIALLRVQGLSSEMLLSRLEKAGILTSPVSGEGLAAQHYVRVNQGTPEENRRFVEAVRSLW